MMKKIVLASTSPFRAELLKRLGLPFVVAKPDCDEASRDGESAESLALRLSHAKAASLADQYPGAILIGSDQVAVLDGNLVGKPIEHAVAAAQLQAASGRTMQFFTGLCVMDGSSQQSCTTTVNTTEVTFKTLNEQQIERYLCADRPYQCAGSFKSESCGIALFSKVQSSDPTALIGLPMIDLVSSLARHGVEVLGT